MSSRHHPYDPRGLIEEAFAIEGISAPECRVIFLDWALSRPEAPDEAAQIEALIAAFATGAPDHPMARVLDEGRAGVATPAGRRGGARARRC